MPSLHIQITEDISRHWTIIISLGNFWIRVPTNNEAGETERAQEDHMIDDVFFESIWGNEDIFEEDI